MDALIPAFVIAALAEIGDRTQLLAILLAMRFRKPVPVLIGIAFAALLTMGLGAAAGAAMAATVNHRTIQLMTGIALVFAGGGAFWRVSPAPPVDGWKIGSLASAFGAFFILEFGDKTQFVAATIAAGSGSSVLVALGAAAGVTVANVPAVLLGERWLRVAPVRGLRIAIGTALVAAGLFMVVRALQII